MKIVNFSGGLGNQIFIYLMTLYLCEKYPKEKIYGYYLKKFLHGHNGLEIQNVFAISLPPSTFFSDLVARLCRYSARFLKMVKATDSYIPSGAIYYDGWWQNKKYFLGNIDRMNFKDIELDAVNNNLLESILTSNSVSLHVRRGDYLEDKVIKKYGGICTLNYYTQAIQIISETVSDPHFFVFSNDIEWCEKNLHIPNAVYVNHNIGKNSYIDMFLMSKCKYNIIANSSFSYWGAMLNRSKNTVIYPKKWFNTYTPDLFPDSWMGI